MSRKIISGIIQKPEQKMQIQLHRQLGDFAQYMQRPKDATEVQRDQKKSVPIPMLPMDF